MIHSNNYLFYYTYSYIFYTCVYINMYVLSPLHFTLFCSSPFHSIQFLFHCIPLEKTLLLKVTDLISQHSWGDVWKILHRAMFILPKGCALTGLMSVDGLSFYWWHLFGPMCSIPLKYDILLVSECTYIRVKLTTKIWSLLRKYFSSLLLLLRLSTIPK